MMETYLRLFVGITGVVALVHLICTANFLKPKSSPIPVTATIALSVGFAVGIIHCAIVGNILQMLIYSSLCLASVLAFNIVVWFYGMHVCYYFERMMKKHEAK